MKTFLQFDMMRARQNAIASRQQRRHVHGELEHKAEKEQSNKEKGYKAL